MRRVALTVLLTLSLLSFSLATGIPQPGERVFTIQVGSFKSKKKALEILEKVKDLPYARISYRKGRFKVRVGFFRTFKEALKFGKAKNLKTPERKCNTRAATVARNKSDRNGSRGVFRVETMMYRLLTGTCVTWRTEKTVRVRKACQTDGFYGLV